MRDMVLTKDCKVYGRQQPTGHGFSVPEKEAMVWDALGRAKTVVDNDARADQPMTSEQPAAPSEIEALRADFKAKTGRDPDPSWSPGRLKNEIGRGQGNGKYNRRDMRAEG